MTICLNEQGAKLYPWLADQKIPFFAYDSTKQSFLIWDCITNEWRLIHQNFCKGDNL